jgi:hypothetical protein
LEPRERFAIYTAYAAITRSWTPVMDAKGAFFSALNAGLLAFLWGNSNVEKWGTAERFCTVAATIASIAGLIFALMVLTPREGWSGLVGRRQKWGKDYKPFSFYGFIAKRYGMNSFRELFEDINQLDEADFALEALEQHFRISQVIQAKSNWVFRSVIASGVGLLFALVGILARAM